MVTGRAWNGIDWDRYIRQARGRRGLLSLINAPQDTIDCLVASSGLPLSILIVGIGNAPELSNMEVGI